VLNKNLLKFITSHLISLTHLEILVSSSIVSSLSLNKYQLSPNLAVITFVNFAVSVDLITLTLKQPAALFVASIVDSKVITAALDTVILLLFTNLYTGLKN